MTFNKSLTPENAKVHLGRTNEKTRLTNISKLEDKDSKHNKNEDLALLNMTLNESHTILLHIRWCITVRRDFLVLPKKVLKGNGCKSSAAYLVIGRMGTLFRLSCIFLITFLFSVCENPS